MAKDKFIISGKAGKIKECFSRIVQSNADVEAIILFSYDGLVMVSTIDTGKREEEEVIAAMISGINSALTHYLKKLDSKTFSRIIIECSNQDILVKDIDPVALLVMLTKAEGINKMKVKDSFDTAVSIVESYK